LFLFITLAFSSFPLCFVAVSDFLLQKLFFAADVLALIVEIFVFLVCIGGFFESVFLLNQTFLR